MAKTGITLSEDEVTFYNYKEPLRRVKKGEGFGYMGVVAYSKDKDMVQCHVCGKFFHMIGNPHLKSAHDMDIDEYREKYQLARSTKLVGEGTREKMIRNRLKGNGNATIEKFNKDKEWREKQRQALIKRNKERKGRKERLELKNKKGTCPDQLLQKIRDLKKKLGHTPSKREFHSHYKGRYTGIIYITFGSYTKAVKRAGLKSQKEIRDEKYSVESLKGYMRDFYVQRGRVPTSSDMMRGLLPDTKTYARRWPTVNHARAEAGIPLWVQISQNKFSAYHPTDEERQRYIRESRVYRKQQAWIKDRQEQRRKEDKMNRQSDEE